MTPLAIRFTVVMVLCAMFSGCAQTGPPLPPSLELPKPPDDLRAVRKGDRVTLTWSVPVRTTDRTMVRSLGPTLICRNQETEAEGCANPVSQVPRPASVKLPESETFIDRLPPEIESKNPLGDVRYVVEVTNRDRRSAGPSNPITVPAMPTLPPPPDFRAELTATGVVFTWTSGGDAATPDLQHRYRIYRRDESNAKETVVSESPVGDGGALRAEDVTFAWEKVYLYRITAVSIQNRAGTEAQVEGDDSPAVRVIARDVFPPAVPSGLQAVYSGEGQKPFVDLIWAPVTDADLAGYNVYRRDKGGNWGKLNSELIKSPSYRDIAVAPGQTYFYSVSAVDLRGNESARSEEASENVP